MTREEAIRLLSGLMFKGKLKEALDMAIKALEQEPRKGHWIDKNKNSATCSCCNRNNTLYGDFCKWCGAKMFEPQESEDKDGDIT